MTEQERQHAIQQRLCRTALVPTAQRSAISTTIPEIDGVLGTRGYPRAAITELFGPESSFKTTLALLAIAGVQRSGGTAAFLDVEHALDARYAVRCGVSLDDLVFSRPGYSEQALDTTCRLAASGAVDLIVIDSAAALVPQVETALSFESFSPGLHTEIVMRHLRRISLAARRTDAAVLFLNQLRTSPSGEPGYTPAGRAFKIAAALRVEIHRLSAPDHLCLRVVRDRSGTPGKEADFSIRIPGTPLATP